MRKMTFQTYIKEYLIDVSGQQSLSVHKLAILSKKNIRIVDPLILHCLFTNKLKTLFKYLDISKYPLVLAMAKTNYLNNDFNLFSFKKIYQSYQRKVNEYNYDNQTKSLIRERILELTKKKKITKYRIYKDLKANPGNINDYLKNNNSKKVSLELATRIFEYCQSF